MGKRCRWAALGATFALLVAACAATEQDPPQAARSTTRSTTSTVVETMVLPETLADASFVRAALPGGPCVAGDDARVALFDAATGAPLWTFDIPRPGGLTELHGDTAYLSFGFDRSQPPGVGAIDLDAKAPVWQRFLEELPEQLERTGSGLIVVSRSSVRALDPLDGTDLWIAGTEFDFTDVVIEGEVAYVLNSIGVDGIDLATGQRQWQFPIERPDELAASGGVVAVAAGSRLVAVDVEQQALRWSERVNRLGAGRVWVSPETVVVELAPSETPAGGLLGLDRSTGIERWQIDNVDDVFWTSDDQIVTTEAAADFRGSEAWDLVGIDAATGARRWGLSTSATASSSVVGVGSNRIVVADPHPAAAGVLRLRLVDTTDGSVLWETASVESIDGASVEVDSFVTIHRTTDTLVGERGFAALIVAPNRSWGVTQPDGIEQSPILTPHGLLVVSGETAPVCVSRALHEPGRLPLADEADISLPAR